MPQPSNGPTPADAFLAVCEHTHLFPGARCRVQGLADPRAFVAEPWSIELQLRFSDYVLAEAELRIDDEAGPVVVVAGHATGAGTSIDGRSWLVRELGLSGGAVELRVGGRVSCEGERPDFTPGSSA